MIRGFLRENPDILKRLQTGRPLSAEDVTKVSAALTEAARKGKVRTGFQFIQGFLVYVEPPPE